MAPLRFRVGDADEGARLDRFLAGHGDIGSRSIAERLIATDAVRVDGAPRPKSYTVTAGETVEVELPVPAGSEEVPVEIAVAFEDEHVLVVDKPAGIVVHPAGPHETGTLAQGLVALGAEGGDPDRQGIVHRLDRDTSGLMVVARSEAAHRLLSELIRLRKIDRQYLALVYGLPRSRTGRIDAPTGRDRRDRTRMSIDTETPRHAVTRFEVRELLGERSLLDVWLETGRTHQIRVHLAAIDLPVCGDPIYGVASDLGLARQFLHACRLRFTHPVTGDDVEVESPLPADLGRALAAARAAAALES